MAALLTLLAALILIAGAARAEGEIASIAQLNAPDISVGVDLGSAAEAMVRELLPKAKLVTYNDKPSAYLAVAQGKLDAFVYERSQMLLAIESGVAGVHLLDECLGEPIQIAVGLSPVTKIPALEEKLNQFIAEMRTDGTLEDMYRRWVIEGDETMPDIHMPENPGLHLMVGTSGIVPPYSYYVGTELTGYDIEMAYRFAAWLGASLEFKVYDYGAIVAAARTGDVDCIMANLNVTPERAEALPFSDTLCEVEIGVMVRGEADAQPASAPDFSAWAGKRIGVQTGAISGQVAEGVIPDIEVSYYNTQADAMMALKNGKVDGWCTDEPIARFMLLENLDLQIAGNLDSSALAAVFPKSDAGQALCEQYSAFVDGLWADGTMAEIDAVWFGSDDARRTVSDCETLPDTNGTLRLALDTGLPPFAYMKDNRIVGYDVDIAIRFCQANGYGLEIIPMSFDGVLPSIQAGKCDFAACGITVTPERAESVLFSAPTYQSGTALIVVAPENGQAVQSELPGAAVTLEDLNGERIGVQTGAIFDAMVEETLPDSPIEYYNTKADLVAALTGHKVEAIVFDEPVAQILLRESDQVTYLPDYLDSYEFAAVFSKGEAGEALRDQFDSFLEQLPEGTLSALADKWFGEDESAKTMPDIAALSAPNGTLRLATESGYVPFEYVRDNGVVGYDMELAAMFCAHAGYGLEIVDMNFDGILPAVQAGKCDLALAGISVTPERAESVLFSKPYFSGGTVAVVLKQEGATAAGGEAYAALDQLRDKRIGIPNGTNFDRIVTDSFPDADISYYPNQSDLLTALAAGKIDAFPSDEPVIRYIMGLRSDVTYIPEQLESYDFAYCFARTDEGEALCEAFSAFIEALRANGGLEALSEKWFNDDESLKTLPDIAALPATNGTLVMATDGDYMPFEYMRDGEIVGYDVDIAAQFCEAHGYGLKIEVMNLDGILPAVQSGKCDFGGSALTITPERSESVLFSAPNYTGGTVMVVLKEQTSAAPAASEAAPASEAGSAFLDGLKESFNKTFVREARWKLFLEGVLTTLLITLLAILFGTALGFAVFMLCRNGNPVANLGTRFSLWLVQGMPMVVLLMILYYIVFGSLSISGIAVAVIGFTLTFGAAVFGLLKMGVGAVDSGQYEAACALGYSSRQTFFKIILPQALPHVLPAFRGEIVGLIKATAIVGYIAVQDLTKMGDIVRSRTYEAFFPLIAVTIIYFALEGLIGFLVSRISVNFNPKRRKPADILKGVKTDD